MPRLRYDPTRDYYAVLRVPDSASQAEIQRAFRRLAKACHPDHHPDRQEWAKATFQAVSEAYRVLGSPQTRRDYDRLRWPHRRPGQGAGRAADWAARPADWAARARAAYTSEDTTYDAAWTYADWARRTPPPPPAPEFAAGNPLRALRALLRGPYGSIYAVVLLVILFMPVSYLAALRFNGFTLDAVVAQAMTTLPDPACQPGAVMIDTPVEGASVRAQVTVTGTAAVPEMTAAVVEWAYLGVEEPEAALAGADWQRAANLLDDPVQGGALATISLPGQAGIYALRLVVIRADGTPLPPCMRVVAYARP